MSAFWSGNVTDFLAADPQSLAETLAYKQAHRFASVEPQQLRSWGRQIATLRASLAGVPRADVCWVLLEFPMLRLGRRIDAVVVTPCCVVVLEFKDKTSFDAADMRQVDDYALDLHDFHAGSRRVSILPILVAIGARAPLDTLSLLLPGDVGPVMRANGATLPALLATLMAAAPGDDLIIPAAWEHAAYRPIPTIIDAARTLYGGHGVADIASAGATSHNLTDTTATILACIEQAKVGSRHVIVFVTGIPGAGKTLCGLNVAFGAASSDATFLTGNPTLVHVFREALARDAAGGDRSKLRVARQKTEKAIQALPRFRDHYASAAAEIPAEHVVVIDEAQRSWSRDYAIRKTRDRPTQLTMSEPGHLLETMARHGDWAAIVCLVGGGQEIHTGEGGLAEWAIALRERPDWLVYAPPDLIAAADPRQRLGPLPGLVVDASLRLDVPIRSLRNPAAAAWVDALLVGDAETARGLAADGALPFVLTRDLGAMRRRLRLDARAYRRCGLLASSGAARLRADGLGVELPHMDAGKVARWFLDWWPDVRASDALEVVATEFSCQGLELDFVGLCWGGDLLAVPSGGWQPRRFAGTSWQQIRGAEAVTNQMNTYRVLLTRARYQTIIWVPRGDPADRTRDPAEMDAVAARLADFGVGELRIEERDELVEAEVEAEAMLL